MSRRSRHQTCDHSASNGCSLRAPVVAMMGEAYEPSFCANPFVPVMESLHLNVVGAAWDRSPRTLEVGDGNGAQWSAHW